MMGFLGPNKYDCVWSHTLHLRRRYRGARPAGGVAYPAGAFSPPTGTTDRTVGPGSRERDTHTRDEHRVALGTSTQSQTANPTTELTH